MTCASCIENRASTGAPTGALAQKLGAPVYPHTPYTTGAARRTSRCATLALDHRLAQRRTVCARKLDADRWHQGGVGRDPTARRGIGRVGPQNFDAAKPSAIFLTVPRRRSVLRRRCDPHGAEAGGPGSAKGRHSPQFGPSPTTADSSWSAIRVKADSLGRVDPHRNRAAALSTNESGYSRNSPKTDVRVTALDQTVGSTRSTRRSFRKSSPIADTAALRVRIMVHGLTGRWTMQSSRRGSEPVPGQRLWADLT
jgi:hypothetical protein